MPPKMIAKTTVSGALVGALTLALAIFAAWGVTKSDQSAQASPNSIVTTVAIDMNPSSTPANDGDTVGSLETCVAIVNSAGQTADFDVVTGAIPLGVRDGLVNGFQYTMDFNGAFTVTAFDHTTAGVVLLHRNPGGWTPLDFSQGQAGLPWSPPVGISMSDLNANGSEGKGESPPNSAGGVLGRYTLTYNGTLPDGVYPITLTTVGYGGAAGPLYDDPTNIEVDDDADTNVDEDILLDGTAGYGQIAVGLDCPAAPTPTPSPTPEADTDGDTVPDDVEGAFGSDPSDPDSTPESLAYDPATCTDGVDNDGDGLIDAQDQGCGDADGDGFDDTAEEEFGSNPGDADSTPEHIRVAGTCTDGEDNDADGLTDSEDEGCSVTPTPGATRSLHWGPGWHNATWSGASTSTPEEAFACASGNYAAAYRLVGGGWERYFPDRPDISSMTDLEQYDAFLILVTGDVTCEMPVADTPATERKLDWSVGWHNEGWTGPDGAPPQDAFACAAGNYAAYRLVGGGWERYLPDRPDVSNMGTLDKYDPFLILTTEPVSCTMLITP
jgi:hypothetical protein